MNKDINLIVDKILDTLMKGIVFLLPLFFLPTTTARIGMDFFNKAYLLWMAAPLIFFLIFLKAIVCRKVYFYKHRFNVLLLVYLFLLFLSLLLGINNFDSFFGSYGAMTQPFLTVLSLTLLLYSVLYYFDSRKKIISSIRLILFSYCLIVSSATLLVLGYFGNKSMLAGYFTLAVGNLEDLAVYLSVLNVLVYSVVTDKALLSSFLQNKYSQWFLKIIFLFSFFILVLINYYLAWLVIFAGITATIVFRKYKKGIDDKEPPDWRLRVKKNLSSIIILTLAMIFLINHFSYGGVNEEKTRFYRNFQLDISNSLNIAIGSIKDNPLLGSGPETYAYQFSKHRPVSFNQSEYWALRFTRGTSFIVEMAATTGILPTAAYLVLFAYILKLAYRGIKRLIGKGKCSKEDAELIKGLWLMMFLLLLVQFFFPVNIVLQFLFWFLTGLIMAYLNILHDFGFLERADISGKAVFKRYGSIAVFIFVSLWLFLAVYEIKFWLADTKYAGAIAMSDTRQREGLLADSIRLNGYRPSFYSTLSKHYLSVAKKEMSKPDEQRNPALINEQINKSIETIRQGIELFPDSVVLYETQGMIYRSMSGVAGNTGPLARMAFEKASDLEPTNPVLKTELGKSMLASKQYDEAILTLKEAMELKDDYFDAHFNLARTYIQTGRDREALEIMNRIEGEINNPEFYYERGRVNYNEGRYDEAIGDFKTVLNNIPLHSNALYSLGLVLSETGNNDEALVHLRKALILNPDSESLKALISKLEND